MLRRLEEGLLYAEASAEDGEGDAQPRDHVVTRDLSPAPSLCRRESRARLESEHVK